MAPSPERTTTDETSTEEPIRRGAAPVESTTDLESAASAELESGGEAEPASPPAWPPVSLEDED